MIFGSKPVLFSKNIHFGGFCMNMKKNECKRRRTDPVRVLLLCTLPPIVLCLLGILYLVEQHAPLTRAAAAYYGSMLEYPMAALMISAVSVTLADLVRRRAR